MHFQTLAGHAEKRNGSSGGGARRRTVSGALASGGLARTNLPKRAHQFRAGEVEDEDEDGEGDVEVGMAGNPLMRVILRDHATQFNQGTTMTSGAGGHSGGYVEERQATLQAIACTQMGLLFSLDKLQ